MVRAQPEGGPRALTRMHHGSCPEVPPAMCISVETLEHDSKQPRGPGSPESLFSLSLRPAQGQAMLPGAASSDPQSDVLVCETGPWKTGARLWGQWKSNDPINGDFSSVILTRASTNHLIWKSRIRVNGWLPGQQQCMMASQVWINQSKTNPRTVTEIYYAHGTNLLPAQIITVILTLSLLRCYCLPSNMLC